MPVRFTRLSAAALGAALLLASPAGAQTPPAPAPPAAQKVPTAAEKDEARALARQATELYEAGKLEDALALFRKTNTLYPTPQGQLYIARCNARLGRLVLARDMYTELVFTALPAGASQNVRDAHAAAQTELDALRARIPSLTVLLVGAPPAELLVSLDGDVVPASELTERNVDPGQHVIKVRGQTAATGGILAERTVTIGEGQRMKIEIDLRSAAGPTASAGPTATPPPGSAAPDVGPASGVGTGRVLSLAVLGLGAVGLGLGVGAGVAALGKADEIKAGCDPVTRQCPASLEPTHREAGALGTASTIGFIAGGACAATGALLFFLLPPRAGAPTGSLQVRVGPASLRVEGAF